MPDGTDLAGLAGLLDTHAADLADRQWIIRWKGFGWT